MELKTGEQLTRFKAHQGVASQVLFLGNDRVISAGDEPTIKLWNWKEKSLIGNFTKHLKSVHGIQLTNNEKSLYSCSSDGQRVLWDLETYSPKAVFQSHGSRILSIDVADGCAFFGQVDGKIGCDALETESTTINLQDAATLGIEKLEYAPAWHSVLFGTRDGLIGIAEADTLLAKAPYKPPRRWKLHEGRLYDFCLLNDGKSVVSVGHDGRLNWFQLDPRLSHDEGTSPVNLHRSLCELINKDLLIYTLEDELWGWRKASDERFRISTLDSFILAIAYSSKTKMLYTSTDSGLLQAWSLEDDTLSECWTVQSQNGVFPHLAIADSRDELAASVDCDDSHIKIYALSSGEYITKLRPTRAVAGDKTAALSYSHDERYLAATVNNSVMLWKKNEPTPRVLSGHVDTVSDLCFAPDDKTLYSLSWDGTCQLWDVETGQSKTKWKHPVVDSRLLAITNDGKNLMSFSESGRVHVWRTDANKLLFQIDSPGQRIK